MSDVDDGHDQAVVVDLVEHSVLASPGRPQAGQFPSQRLADALGMAKQIAVRNRSTAVATASGSPTLRTREALAATWGRSRFASGAGTAPPASGHQLPDLLPIEEFAALDLGLRLAQVPHERRVGEDLQRLLK